MHLDLCSFDILCFDLSFFTSAWGVSIVLPTSREIRGAKVMPGYGDISTGRVPVRLSGCGRGHSSWFWRGC